MTKKEFGRSIAFLLVACMMLILLCDLFELDNSKNYDKRFTTFRALPEDTVDAVWIGTSGVDRYWIAGKAYDDYGMTVYPLATDAMPTWLFTHVIDEAFAHQNPKLVIVDARAFGQNNNEIDRMDASARRTLSAMDLLSVNRFKAALKTTKVMADTFEDNSLTDMSYLLSYIKHHSMWEEDSYTIAKHLGNREHLYMGYYMDHARTPVAEEQEPVVYDPNLMEPLDPLAEESLYDLLAYAEERNIELLFIDTPQFKNAQEIGRANTLYKILEEHGIEYLNFCYSDAEGNFTLCTNLDPKEDFYNKGHVNYYGSKKFTKVMAAYLDENYDFADRREDPEVQADWDGIYKKIEKKVARWAKDLKD